ncbi:MAG: pilus assembly protein PilM [Desulfobulbaceae bacterium]|nr:pilus assembly protein PilM [Desulfobulbaceae bacterium]
MAKKDKLIVGLDIGSHAIKLCHLQKSGSGYALLALGSTVIPAGAVEDGVLQEPEQVGESLAALFKNLKIKEKKVGISISGYSVIVKKIQLDPMSEEELDEYIKEEAEQYIPFDREDVYLDYQDLETSTEDEDRTDVMLVAAKKEVVDGYLDLLLEHGLNPVLVDVDGFALENIWDVAGGVKDNIALVDIGACKMNVNIIVDGVSVLARDIVGGSQQLTDQIADHFGIESDEAEQIKLGILPADDKREELEEIFVDACTNWVLEIKKAIDLFSANQADSSLKKLVLSGGGAKVPGLSSFLKRETGLDVVKFNPFVNMKVNGKKIDPKYVESIGPEMAIAAGLAIRTATF